MHGSAGWLYPYGLLALDAAVATLIVAAVAFPASLATRFLALGPLRALGKMSYGLYLWHFPLFLWLSAGAVGVSGTPLLLVRLAATLAVSTASYFLIEQPIRQRRRPTWIVRALTPLAAGGAVAALLLASAADQLPVGIPAAATLPQPPPQLRGSDPSCTVALKDTSDYGVAPVPSEQADVVRVRRARSAQADLERVGPEDLPDVSAEARARSSATRWRSRSGCRGSKTKSGTASSWPTARSSDVPSRLEGELDVDGTWEGQSEGCSTAPSGGRRRLAPRTPRR